MIVPGFSFRVFWCYFLIQNKHHGSWTHRIFGRISNHVCLKIDDPQNHGLQFKNGANMDEYCLYAPFFVPSIHMESNLTWSILNPWFWTCFAPHHRQHELHQWDPCGGVRRSHRHELTGTQNGHQTSLVDDLAPETKSSRKTIEATTEKTTNRNLMGFNVIYITFNCI